MFAVDYLVAVLFVARIGLELFGLDYWIAFPGELTPARLTLLAPGISYRLRSGRSGSRLPLLEVEGPLDS